LAAGVRPALIALLFAAACSGGPRPVVIGSKNFTESVILGEIVAQQLERAGVPVERKLNLGGTFVCHAALIAGQLDGYVEYTGTAYAAVLKLPPAADARLVTATVDTAYRNRWQLAWMPSLGFDNTFAMLVRRADAERLHISSLSDAVPFAKEWRAAFGYEFMERADGFPGLAARYGLAFRSAPSVMDLGLTYRALADGKVDMIAGNSTDGQIKALDLVQLADDRHYFPPYEAAPVVRAEMLQRYPAARRALMALAGTISAETMRNLNYEVDVQHRDARQVALEFVSHLPPAGTP
jgi:glycine betaine/choline ABC-type transport system substrate-binding protein